MLHETIRKDDFYCNAALQHNVATLFRMVTTLL